MTYALLDACAFKVTRFLRLYAGDTFTYDFD